ncbi:fimbrial biogenesis chaperone [Pseudomonas reactans]
MLRQTFSLVTALLALFMYGQSQAAITLSSTRVVFEGSKKEASITVRNMGNEELLIQSWLDSGADSASSIPFAVTPPLAHMGGQSRQVLRMLYQGSGVPADKESVFWLNVQEVPKTSEIENVLQLAIRQRVKMFYRPVGLTGTSEEAPAELTWKVVPSGKDSVLRINNPTKFHVSMADLKVEGAQFTSAPINSFMISPGENYDVVVEKLPASGSMTLTANVINDFGGKDLYSAPLLREAFKLKSVKPVQ